MTSEMPYTITPVSKKHLPALVDLHIQVMKTLLADLGRPFVQRFYERAIVDRNVIALCALNDCSDVVGWVVGSSEPNALNAQIRRPISWFVIHVVAVLFSRPRVFIQLLLSVITARAISSSLDEGIELTYIGVSPLLQGKGVGKALLASFLKAAQQRGHSKVLLTVETHNSSALRMYEQAGFKIVKSYQEGAYHRHRLELSLR